MPPTANFAGDTRRRALRAALKSASAAVVVRKPTMDVCAHGTPSAQLNSMTCTGAGVWLLTADNRTSRPANLSAGGRA
jgi:hypothetical protein